VQTFLERLGWQAVVAAVLVFLGSLGLGWRGVPGEKDLEAALLTRARAVAVESDPPRVLVDAEVQVESVRRDWLHEILGTRGSRFYVRATIAGESACYYVEPEVMMTWAFGPVSSGCE